MSKKVKREKLEELIAACNGSRTDGNTFLSNAWDLAIHDRHAQVKAIVDAAHDAGIISLNHMIRLGKWINNPKFNEINKTGTPYKFRRIHEYALRHVRNNALAILGKPVRLKNGKSRFFRLSTYGDPNLELATLDKE